MPRILLKKSQNLCLKIKIKLQKAEETFFWCYLRAKAVKCERDRMQGIELKWRLPHCGKKLTFETFEIFVLQKVTHKLID